MKIIVKSYKPSGKWYHTEETQIELQTIDDVLVLEEKIKCNDKSIQHLSGLTQGFSPDFTYMVKLVSDSNLFMDFVIHSNEFTRSSEIIDMTDKQIIIDGCNVTGCEYLGLYKECKLKSGSCCPVNCSDNPNCHYKRFIRAMIERNKYKQALREIEQLIQVNKKELEETLYNDYDDQILNIISKM